MDHKALAGFTHIKPAKPPLFGRVCIAKMASSLSRVGRNVLLLLAYLTLPTW
jgi:hypothetical protein